ncbi:MAG: hypothetical protein ACKOQ6_02905 [Bacteroidota bacterium]
MESRISTSISTLQDRVTVVLACTSGAWVANWLHNRRGNANWLHNRRGNANWFWCCCISTAPVSECLKISTLVSTSANATALAIILIGVLSITRKSNWVIFCPTRTIETSWKTLCCT